MTVNEVLLIPMESVLEWANPPLFWNYVAIKVSVNFVEKPSSPSDNNPNAYCREKKSTPCSASAPFPQTNRNALLESALAKEGEEKEKHLEFQV